MGSVDLIATAAQATAGTDLLAAATADAGLARISEVFRTITEVGFVGSTAVGDCAVRISIGGTYQGTYYNSTAGAAMMPLPNRDIKVLTTPLKVPKGATVQAIMTAAANANAVVLHLEFTESAGKSGWGGKRRGSGRRYGRRF